MFNPSHKYTTVRISLRPLIIIQTQLPDMLYKAIEARAVALGHDASKIRMVPRLKALTARHSDATTPKMLNE